MTDTGYRVEFDGEDELICECRPGTLRRALSNLIENAVKYGGGARVELRKIDSAVEIVVEDDGPGIPETELGKVFSPFYRVEPSRGRKTGGVGLGLSVAQSVIDKHGGEIELTNREEGGLRVRIILPA
ncbi:MAG: ATP-binding protein, partial [Rhodospirillales bacterium]|nr:ATP-binding protein [Rhodospirillales bacterium]